MIFITPELMPSARFMRASTAAIDLPHYAISMPAMPPLRRHFRDSHYFHALRFAVIHLLYFHYA